VVGSDELVLLVPPSHPFAKRRQVSMEDVAGEPVGAHNDPSPARERVLRLFEQRHISLKLVIALPSLDGIKRAVELKLGVALLPRRCAITEIASGRLSALPATGPGYARVPARASISCVRCVPGCRPGETPSQLIRVSIQLEGEKAELTIPLDLEHHGVSRSQFVQNRTQVADRTHFHSVDSTNSVTAVQTCVGGVAGLTQMAENEDSR